ncbi:unnamed protein product [Rotaria sordida]|uniref:DNA-directed RNA polymerase n=1 Tax=Rotaria sordida TaxID=392033 RepID=A0A815N0B7_9BILA|nr:unnamed protein product [Rotaria sordida]
MTDTDVIIRRGHLLPSLIDKVHCGSILASIVRCYYELYGKRYAADLVTKFSKLFTLFLTILSRSIDEYKNQIIKQCMSHLFNQFPDNNLQLLIQSGAKGLVVNSDLTVPDSDGNVIQF